MTNRSGKWYRKNERSVMELLGLTPTKNSGSGWVEKEDGQSDDIICQLKSTDAMSIKVNLSDIQTLEYNAQVAHKLPVFAVQFIGTDDVFCVVRPELLKQIAKYIQTGKVDGLDFGLQMGDGIETGKTRKMIRSSESARMETREQIENKYKKKTRSAT